MNSAIGAIGSMWSQKILNVARIGTARIIPEMPHIQPQNARAIRTVVSTAMPRQILRVHGAAAVSSAFVSSRS
jgi:hypothetical protein